MRKRNEACHHKFACKQCGKKETRYEKGGIPKFCSRECYFKYIKENPVKRAPVFKVYKKRQRMVTCLGVSCRGEKTFHSFGKHNRICPRCSELTKKYFEDPLTYGESDGNILL